MVFFVYNDNSYLMRPKIWLCDVCGLALLFFMEFSRCCSVQHIRRGVLFVVFGSASAVAQYLGTVQPSSTDTGKLETNRNGNGASLNTLRIALHYRAPKLLFTAFLACMRSVPNCAANICTVIHT